MAGLNTRTGQRNVDYVPKLTAKEARPSSTIVARSESPRATTFVPGQMTEQFANRNTPQSQPNYFDAYTWLSQQNQQQAGQAMQQAIDGYRQISEINFPLQQKAEQQRADNTFRQVQTQSSAQVAAAGSSAAFGKDGPQWQQNQMEDLRASIDPFYGAAQIKQAELNRKLQMQSDFDQKNQRISSPFSDDVRTNTWSSIIPGQPTSQQAQLEMARMQFEQGQHRNAIDRQNEEARNRAATQQAGIGAEASVLSSMFGSMNNQGFRYW